MGDLVLTRLRWPEVLADQAPWERLRAAAPTEALFLTPDWLETWWRHLGPGGEPSILTVQGGGDLLAIAPLMRVTPLMAGPVVLRPLGANVADYLDLLLPAERGARERCLAAVLDGLLGRPGWHVLDLLNLPAESPTVDDLRRLAGRRGLPIRLLPGYRRPAISLDGSWDAYLHGRPAKFRYNLRSRLRRLSTLGEVAFRTVTDPDGVTRALPDLTHIHARRWAGQRTSTIFSSTPAGRAFYAEASRRYARRGLLECSLLELDGRPIAGCLSFVERDTFYYYVPAWEPEFAAYAPSTMLLAHLVERAFARGLRRFDFMLGEEEYKSAWATETRSTVRLLIGHGGTRGRAGVAALTALHRTRQRARASFRLRHLRRYGARSALAAFRATGKRG
jgi:CelD/BcsL family acetyltransferase involved in cellulose biosynthesis